MSTTTTYITAGIISEARNIDGAFADNLEDIKGSPGKFEYVVDSCKELALAVHTIILNGFADEEAEDGWAIVGNVLYKEDEFGFVYIWPYPTEAEATSALMANIS